MSGKTHTVTITIDTKRINKSLKELEKHWRRFRRVVRSSIKRNNQQFEKHINNSVVRSPNRRYDNRFIVQHYENMRSRL